MPKLVPQLNHCILEILFFLRRRRENPCRGLNLLGCKGMILQIQSCHHHPQTRTQQTREWEGRIRTNLS